MGHHCECYECGGSGCEICGYSGKLSSRPEGCKSSEMSLDEILASIWDAIHAKDDEKLRGLLAAYKDKTGKDRPGFMA
jgi:hypothetical protein